MERLQYNIIPLITQWQERAKSSNQPKEYRCAVSECLTELQGAIDAAEGYYDSFDIPSEEALDYLEGLEADMYLSRMDAHEPNA